MVTERELWRGELSAPEVCNIAVEEGRGEEEGGGRGGRQGRQCVLTGSV